MKLAIPLAIIAETTKCQKQFACLSQPVETLCKVVEFVLPPAGATLFVQCRSNQSCSYKLSWGYTGNICTCPTRLAIYKQSKI